MKIYNIDIEELNDYVYNALLDDVELLKFYDKNVQVKTTEDCINNIIEKINLCYSDADIFGVEDGGLKIGYFVCTHDLLISFGLNINYRDKETLTRFWNFIKSIMADNFQCVLYSNNRRGINFLEKGGMKVLFDSVTILTNN